MTTYKQPIEPTPRLLRWLLFSLISCFLGGFNTVQAQALKGTASKKILFVLTSHDKKGSTGEATGYFLSEAAHPWAVLHDAGYQIDFVSPKGGNPPVDAFDLKDSINNRFWQDSKTHQKLTHSLQPSQINPKDYCAIFYAGGHGAMWDFPNNKRLASIAASIYTSGGLVAAVCHGPAALLNIQEASGRYLIQGKKITGFTNEEETLKKLDKVVPFLLESQLSKRGAAFEKTTPFKAHVVVDGRLITGQNPASATGVGQAILSALQAAQNK